MESAAYSKRTSGGPIGGKRWKEEEENGVPPAPLHLGAVSASPNDFNIFRMFLALFPLIVDISGELLNDGLIARRSFPSSSLSFPAFICFIVFVLL